MRRPAPTGAGAGVATPEGCVGVAAVVRCAAGLVAAGDAGGLGVEVAVAVAVVGSPAPTEGPVGPAVASLVAPVETAGVAAGLGPEAPAEHAATSSVNAAGAAYRSSLVPTSGRLAPPARPVVRRMP